MNSDSTEFRIAKCKACESDIRLPTTLRASAKIQCPLCKEKFWLSDIDGPPVAIVVEDEETDPSAAAVVDVPHVDKVISESGDKNVWEATSVPSYESTTSRGRKRAQHQTPEHGSQAAPNVQLDVQANRKSHHKSERRRKEQIKGNKKKDLLKMVLGGLLAIPVSQLALWWIAGVDPLSLAPQVSQYVPAIVPQKLRPVSDDDTDDLTSDQQDAPDVPPGMTVIPGDNR